MNKLKLRQDIISDDVAYPTHEGHSITIYNQGTFVLKINDMVRLVPGEQWVATTDSSAYLTQFPRLAFDESEAKEYINIASADLPSYLTKRGRFAVIQYLQPI